MCQPEFPCVVADPMLGVQLPSIRSWWVKAPWLSSMAFSCHPGEFQSTALST